ncbi:MAG: hypothetical protein IH843_05125 [Thaumarchaeota archaeon]|nr:hypothetical protein [Nitrososphaerota archaeon]
MQGCDGFRSLHREKEGWYCKFFENGIMKETKKYKNPVAAVKEMKEHD